MFGLQEIIRINELAVERQRGNTRDPLDKFIGQINCLKHPGLIPQCSRCSNYIVCLEISQAINN
ncbi:hypothetical protein ES703_29610 [subsurface metagenome]